MKKAGALDLLDDGLDVAGRLPGWVGLLWFTALPSRLLLAFFCARLVGLGESAVHYADWARRISWLIVAAWLVSLWGRQAYVRACRFALASGRAVPRGLHRVPPREMAAHVVAALAVELLFWATLVTWIAPPFLLVAAALAAVASPAGGPGPLDALGALARAVGPFWRLVRLLLVFALALALAAINLHALAGALVWLASAVPGVDAAGFGALIDPGRPDYAILILTGATLLLEPIWLAALTSHVEHVRAQSTGDDLRRWFAEIRARA